MCQTKCEGVTIQMNARYEFILLLLFVLFIDQTFFTCILDLD